MARPLRIQYSGAVYHITSRGNEKKPIFKDDKDRSIFLNILKDVNKRHNWLCHAYCLMDNHYHLIIETLDGTLSRGMRQLNGVYTQTLNKRHRRVGHIFQGRYKAILIDKENYLLEAYRYVVLNPVRAKMVEAPEEWKWSSYRGTAGIETPHLSVTTDWILGQFGTKKGLAEKRYMQFIREGVEKESIWTRLKGQILLGETTFVERFGGYLKGQKEVEEIPRNQRYINRPKLDELFGKNVMRHKPARDNKIAAAVERYGYTQKAVADYLKMHYSTISRLIKNETMSKNKT
ncbi:MAG: transposase [Deltaproteobacteria bacterium]|nr:transposase [Deltaproteobacteria bacterium]